MIIKILAAFLLGGLVGFCITCTLIVGSDADKQNHEEDDFEEEYYTEE